MIKQENVGKIHNNNYCCEMGFLWEKIGSLIDFSFETYDTDFTYVVKPNEKIVYHDTGSKTYIVLKNKFSFNDAFAVRDEVNPNRYFVGFTTFTATYNTNMFIVGMIIYFDKGILKNKNIITRLLSSVDCRNGEIVTVLYNQTLIFKQIHRDTNVLLLNLALLSYDDTLIAKHRYYFDKIKSGDNQREIINKRFLSINNHLFDLSSTRLEKSTETPYFTKNIEINKLIINSYEITDNENIIIEDNDYYNDGYPSNCIICNGVTSIASYECEYITKLGKAYCINCQIRYSITDQRWVCCKLTEPNNYMCGNTITKNSFCKKDHSTTSIYVQYYEDQILKFPYKQSVVIGRK